MPEFTTGEAVALELPIARIPTRAGAFFLDVLVQFVLGTILLFGSIAVLVGSGADSAWLSAALITTIVGVLVGYPTVFETFLRGRTPGKAAFGLRVVRSDGGPIDFRHALTRGLAGVIVDFWMLGAIGAVAVITSMCSPNARRIGDVLAGTVVVHSQKPLPFPLLAVAPPWLAGWAGQLELSGIREDLALPVRQYLSRANTLTPAAQLHLGQQLVVAVCARMQIPVPTGYPPVQILGAVIAERQRRTLMPLTASMIMPRPVPIARPG